MKGMKVVILSFAFLAWGFSLPRAAAQTENWQYYSAPLRRVPTQIQTSVTTGTDATPYQIAKPPIEATQMYLAPLATTVKFVKCNNTYGQNPIFADGSN